MRVYGQGQVQPVEWQDLQRSAFDGLKLVVPELVTLSLGTKAGTSGAVQVSAIGHLAKLAGESPQITMPLLQDDVIAQLARVAVDYIPGDQLEEFSSRLAEVLEKSTGGVDEEDEG